MMFTVHSVNDRLPSTKANNILSAALVFIFLNVRFPLLIGNRRDIGITLNIGTCALQLL